MKPVPEEFRILQLIRELGMPTSEKIFNRDAWLAGLLRGRRTVASSSANYKWHRRMQYSSRVVVRGVFAASHSQVSCSYLRRFH
jgi:hypothetical protein